jgi:hypothetical protein
VKTCYGVAYLGKEDFPEENINHKIKLKYYKIKNLKNNIIGKKTKKYGIEILKKEYNKDNVSVERNAIEDISTNRNEVIAIINTLKKYKVTPIGLNDVLEDLLKQEPI